MGLVLSLPFCCGAGFTPANDPRSRVQLHGAGTCQKLGTGGLSCKFKDLRQVRDFSLTPISFIQTHNEGQQTAGCPQSPIWQPLQAAPPPAPRRPQACPRPLRGSGQAAAGNLSRLAPRPLPAAAAVSGSGLLLRVAAGRTGSPSALLLPRRSSRSPLAWA